MFGKIRKIIDRYTKYSTGQVQERYIKKSLNALKEKKTLTKDQKREIQEYYKGLIGKKISLTCHQYFYSRSGVYSKEYVPTYLYHTDIIGKANMMPYRDALADKNMCDIILPNVKHPKTILKNMNGYYYMDGEPVTKEEAVRRCWNIHNMLIKPSLEKHGHGVKSLEVTDGVTNHDGVTIDQVFDKYKKNFQIQERLKQHERMSALNPTSVNTIRILSYRSDMEVLIVYAVVRIGRKGQVIDNQSAGGMSANISKDGKLGKYAYGGSAEDNITQTDSGVTLEGYEIPSYEKVLETVKRLHFQMPFFNLVGWDMAVDEEGDPVILEWNANTGLSQSAFGPGLGDYTERIIKELWPRPNNFNKNW